MPKKKQIGAFFDLDDTLINTNSAFKLGTHLIKKGQIPILKFLYFGITGLLYLLYLYPSEKLLKNPVQLFKGRHVSRYQKYADEVFLPQKKLYKQSVLKKYKEHKKQGHKVFIITQTYDIIAEYFARDLKPDELIASKPEIIKDIFTGKDTPMAANQKYKEVLRLKKKYDLDLSSSYAYTDSIHDIKMLEQVKYVYVTTKNPYLRWVAWRRGWKIIR